MAEHTNGPAGGAGAGRGNGKPHHSTQAPAAAGPDLRDLHGRTCPSYQEARVRVVERAGLVLLTCGSGCPGRDIEAAAKLAARPEVVTVTTCPDRTGQVADSATSDRTDRFGNSAPERTGQVPESGTCDRPAEVSKLDTCHDRTGQDGPLDPFDRFLLRLAYGPRLLPAAQALTLAALDSAAPAEALLARQALAALAPVEGLRAWPWYDDKPEQPAPAPLERVAADVAAVLVEGVLAASPGRRGEAAGLLRAVARFGARGPAAAPARAAA